MVLQRITIIIGRVLPKKDPIQYRLPVRIVGIYLAKLFLVAILLNNVGDFG